MPVIAQAELLAGLHGGEQRRPFIDGEDSCGQPHQLLGIMTGSAGGLDGIRRNEVIDGVYAGGHGMAPCDALHRGEARIREKIRQWIHPDVRVEQYVELLLRHDHQGLDLRQDYAKEVMRSLLRIWKRPVNVTTSADGKPVMLRYDGKEYATLHLRT